MSYPIEARVVLRVADQDHPSRWAGVGKTSDEVTPDEVAAALRAPLVNELVTGGVLHMDVADQEGHIVATRTFPAHAVSWFDVEIRAGKAPA